MNRWQITIFFLVVVITAAVVIVVVPMPMQPLTKRSFSPFAFLFQKTSPAKYICSYLSPGRCFICLPFAVVVVVVRFLPSAMMLTSDAIPHPIPDAESCLLSSSSRLATAFGERCDSLLPAHDTFLLLQHCSLLTDIRRDSSRRPVLSFFFSSRRHRRTLSLSSLVELRRERKICSLLSLCSNEDISLRSKALFSCSHSSVRRPDEHLRLSSCSLLVPRVVKSYPWSQKARRRRGRRRRSRRGAHGLRGSRVSSAPCACGWSTLKKTLSLLRSLLPACLSHITGSYDGR